MAAAAVVAGGALAIYFRVVLPCRCNVTLRALEERTRRLADDLESQYVVALAARANLDMISGCLRYSPSVNLQMVAAANYRFLHRYDVAIAMYEWALETERRPELYLNLGETQLEAGRVTEGIASLTYACSVNPEYTSELSRYREEVNRGVAAYHRRLKALDKRSEK